MEEATKTPQPLASSDHHTVLALAVALLGGKVLGHSGTTPIQPTVFTMYAFNVATGAWGKLTPKGESHLRRST
ncbi:MAG: hypothetical protein KME27_07940 [Lyngbya sp. HA4199-MV5]|nr:hypothetical protein [Lyngbya sp. HA4199-MV5]